MAEKDIYLGRAVKKMKLPYLCTKCNHQHRPGVNVWFKHLDYIDKRSLPKEVRKVRLDEKAKAMKRGKAEKMEWKKERQGIILKEFNKKLPGLKNGRYHLWTIDSSYGLRHAGLSDGYDTLNELYKGTFGKGNYSIKEAEKGETIAIIMKSVPYKIIKKF